MSPHIQELQGEQGQVQHNSVAEASGTILPCTLDRSHRKRKCDANDGVSNKKRSSIPIDATTVVEENAPLGKFGPSFMTFVDLPKTDEYCSFVDTKHGQWAHCGLCNKAVKTWRNGREFTVGRWKEHLNEMKHKQLAEEKHSKIALALKKKAQGGKLNMRDQRRHDQLKKSQQHMFGYFSKKPPTKKTASLLTTASTALAKAAVEEAAAVSVMETLPTPELGLRASKKSMQFSCEGIMPNYREETFQAHLRVYNLYSSVKDTSLYGFGFTGKDNFSQIFVPDCTRANGKLRKNAYFGDSYSCAGCFELL